MVSFSHSKVIKDVEGFRCRSSALGDLREKMFKRAWWPKCFFVKPSKARAVTLEQLVAIFSPLNLL